MNFRLSVRRALLASALFAAPFLLSAQPVSSPAASAPSISLPPASSLALQRSSDAASAANTAAALTQENLLLREQVKLMKEYHGSLLDTVYFAMAGVFTLALLLGGWQWYTNNRVYDADKQRLKEDLQGDLKKVVADLTSRILTAGSTVASALAMTDSQIGEKVALALREHDAKVDRRLESSADRTAGEFSQLRTELANERADLNSSIQKLQEALRSLERSVNWTEYETKRLDEEVWALHKIPANQLIGISQRISAATKISNDFFIDQAIERARELLEPRDFKISVECEKVVTAQLEKARARRPQDVERLLELVKEHVLQPTASAIPEMPIFAQKQV